MCVSSMVILVLERNRHLIPGKMKMDMLRGCVEHINVEKLILEIENRQILDLEYLNGVVRVDPCLRMITCENSELYAKLLPPWKLSLEDFQLTSYESIILATKYLTECTREFKAIFLTTIREYFRISNDQHSLIMNYLNV